MILVIQFFRLGAVGGSPLGLSTSSFRLTGLWGAVKVRALMKTAKYNFTLMTTVKLNDRVVSWLSTRQQEGIV